ncbi:ABC transporter ATP-binding protein [Pediococcus argentinicus]|uniref:Peptide ABC transporter ATPase n=1 Tax=Pediococcus argentinicus TaxID=480391 RepID=A0A0R2NI47_9LACO|nr:ABC transporter ATP-binding protein [Pediococcus argentinicus]KRO25473.1 peptide ABC transporter ATPase [Pediococcus argentinicus]NKZ22167.1 ABC transporter ATP-binding protein [Pediococcus argentinicus]GEP19216.1 nitrate ABC transporter ATP-binding protein [Pediococcus argentinicus]
MDQIEIKNIKKSFGSHQILNDISIHVDSHEIVSILGVSGVGKTTLFNIVAGISNPDQGQVIYNQQDITGQSGFFSYMLQKDLLLPYRTIMGNAILPSIIKNTSKKEAIQKAAPAFKIFGLEGTENKYPNQLSGGMRQRAALLRTYLASKNVNLLDEPFSALDELTKRNIYKWYLDLNQKIGTTTLLITHSVDEAVTLSDRVYILSGQPATITKELVIDSPQKRTDDFELTEDFLKYKKEILTSL